MIPRKLIEARDRDFPTDLAPIEYNGYRTGFNAAVKLILESDELKGLQEASQKYFDSMNSFEPDYDYQCECFGALRSALTQWREYLGSDE